MENWQVALLTIAAVFAGVLIPMIIQYQVTLRSVHRLIRDNESDIRRAVIETSQLATHLNRIGASLDANSKHVGSLFELAEEVGDGLRRLRGTVRTASVVGAALAPAIGAAIRAMQPAAEQEPEEEPVRDVVRREANGEIENGRVGL